MYVFFAFYLIIIVLKVILYKAPQLIPPPAPRLYCRQWTYKFYCLEYNVLSASLVHFCLFVCLKYRLIFGLCNVSVSDTIPKVKI